MFNFMKKAVVKGTQLMAEIFVPGVGPMEVPIEEAEGYLGGHAASVMGYNSVSDIRKTAKRRARRAKENRKPVFVLSKSRIFRKRVGRIIYGKEGEDVFL